MSDMGQLFVVGTPIGNLEDMTLRAISTLQNVNLILAEDTRNSKKLLNAHNIDSKMISYHDHSSEKEIKKIVDLLLEGKDLALISDAGTPTISDPGYGLIRECIKNDITIFPIPGASAVTSAIYVSGFSEKFYFYGFLPEKKKNLSNDLLKLSSLDCSIVFFISAKKLEKTLTEFKKYFLERNILICREMTKIYEEFVRSNVREIDISNLTLKGEVTVVISEKIDEKKSSQTLSESDKNKIKKMIKKLSIKEITALICLDKKISKKEVYNYCLKIKNEN